MDLESRLTFLRSCIELEKKKNSMSVILQLFRLLNSYLSYVKLFFFDG